MSAGCRIAARTECPASASSATRARPTKPDAPVTRMRVTVCLGSLSRQSSRVFDNRPEAKPTRYVTTAGSPAKRGHHRSRREKERPALCSQTTGLFAFGGVKAQPYNHNGASEVRFEFSYFHAVPEPMIAAFGAAFEPVACEGRRGAGCPPDGHS